MVVYRVVYVAILVVVAPRSTSEVSQHQSQKFTIACGMARSRHSPLSFCSSALMVAYVKRRWENHEAEARQLNRTRDVNLISR